MAKTNFLKRSLKGVAVAICLAGSATMCFAQETGVVINGVTWATCNVDKPGTFVAKPENSGMLYQWNRNKAWSATTPAEGVAIKDWDITTTEGTEWAKENDPSPVGWRIPTSEEMNSLLDEAKVKIEWDDTKKGTTFTDIESGASIFMPYVIGRGTVDRLAYQFNKEQGKKLGNLGEASGYWSSTLQYGEKAYSMGFGINLWAPEPEFFIDGERRTDVSVAIALRPVKITAQPTETE